VTLPIAKRPTEPSTDPWEASRELQRRFWSTQPVERRVAWLEEAVAAAYLAGTLPRRADVDRDRAPVVQLVGSSEECATAEEARRDVLERVRSYCRGPVPSGTEPIAFAVSGAELQFALWRESDAQFWIAIHDASVEAIAARVASSGGDCT
jgi:hypothetical protein